MHYTEKQKFLLPNLSAANINADSFLATDYLNHYNEIVMLLEMVPDMPDMAEDCMDWQPATYSQHFRNSGFAAKELAVEAYENAPAQFKQPFDQVIEEMDALIQSTLNGLRAVNVAERGVSPAARQLLVTRTLMMQELLGKMNRLIHGKLPEGVELSAAAAEKPAPKAATRSTVHQETDQASDGEDTQSQEDIDALFD